MTYYNYQIAQEDFFNARRKAAFQQVMARLSGKSSELLRYDQVQTYLRPLNTSDRGLQDIPLDAIVGSVGRFEDYTRSFLPKHDSDAVRWANVRHYIEENGIPPIDVFKIGEVYFVKDGNHRVSIARQLDFQTIPAYVIEVKTRVPLSAQDDLEDILCKARYVNFLEQTNLDRLRPEANLYLSFCGQYDLLLDHIQVHQYFMGLDFQREIPYVEAVTHWYDTVYLPVIDLIQELGLLKLYPGRTEADLYVLVAQHREKLEEDLGWQIEAEDVTADLVRKSGKLIQEEECPPELQPCDEGEDPAKAQLFEDILVAGRGLPADETMLRHAIRVAQRENARLLGLRVVAYPTEEKSAEVQAVLEGFRSRCQEAGVRAEAAVETGSVPGRIIQRAAWADLVTLSLVRTSANATQVGFGSDLNQILQRSPRPVLIVPEEADSMLDRPLLAYDGSPKSNEALYLSAYVAARWKFALTVLSVGAGLMAEDSIERARRYLNRYQIQAEYITQPGNIAETILETAQSRNCNFIIMGGFGERALFQWLLGSTVDKVLAITRIPVVVCR